MKILISENEQHVVESCRVMAKNGHTILFATPFTNSLKNKIFLSKSYSKIISLNQNTTSTGKIKALKQIYTKFDCDVFYPFGYKLVTDYIEESYKNNYLRMNTPYGRYEKYWKISNKYGLYELLEESKINLPKLYGRITNNEEPDLQDLSFPLIVKKTKGCGIKNNVKLILDKEKLKNLIKETKNSNNINDEYIAQQYIPGEIFDVGGFSIDGVIFYHVPQRRTVTYPLRGGVAAVNDICNDSKLLDLAKIVIKKSEWTGPFQVEFRYNPKDKKYYLLEVNAKMWGSTPLSLKANQDLLNIALNVAIGNQVEKRLHYSNSLRYRWICNQELKAIINGNLKDYLLFLLRFLKPAYYDIDLDDPLPDIYRFLESLNMILFNRKKIQRSLVSNKMHKELND
jgi:predicted ATP-grasp superfamily ATP-dependent carboligase